MNFNIESKDRQWTMHEGTEAFIVRIWMNSYHYTSANLDYIITDDRGQEYRVTDDSGRLEEYNG